MRLVATSTSSATTFLSMGMRREWSRLTRSILRTSCRLVKIRDGLVPAAKRAWGTGQSRAGLGGQAAAGLWGGTSLPPHG